MAVTLKQHNLVLSNFRVVFWVFWDKAYLMVGDGIAIYDRIATSLNEGRWFSVVSLLGGQTLDMT